MENYLEWCELNEKNPKIMVSALILIDCPKEVLWERIAQRGKTELRTDDNLDTFKRRMKVFEEETSLVVEQFKSAKKLIQINGNCSRQGVFEQALEQVSFLSYN